MALEFLCDKENPSPEERRERREAKTERAREYLLLAVSVFISHQRAYSAVASGLSRGGQAEGFSYFP